MQSIRDAPDREYAETRDSLLPAAADFFAQLRKCRQNVAVRSRLLLLGFLPLALAACGGGSKSASTPAKPAAPAKAPQTKALTIRVTSIVKTTRSKDQPPKGTSPGDKVEFEDVLLNATPQFGKGTNAQVGRDTGTMTITSTNTFRMDGVTTLPGGTIVFKGQVTVLPNSNIAIPITGGTGKYAHASGTLLVGRGDKKAPNTYILVVAGNPVGPVA